MLPAKGPHVGQQIGRKQVPFSFLAGDNPAQLHGVPEGDDRGEQVAIR